MFANRLAVRRALARDVTRSVTPKIAVKLSPRITRSLGKSAIYRPDVRDLIEVYRVYSLILDGRGDRRGRRCYGGV